MEWVCVFHFLLISIIHIIFKLNICVHIQIFCYFETLRLENSIRKICSSWKYVNNIDRTFRNENTRKKLFFFLHQFVPIFHQNMFVFNDDTLQKKSLVKKSFTSFSVFYSIFAYPPSYR